jgi:hypothetical protein
MKPVVNRQDPDFSTVSGDSDMHAAEKAYSAMDDFDQKRRNEKRGLDYYNMSNSQQY